MPHSVHMNGLLPSCFIVWSRSWLGYVNTFEQILHIKEPELTAPAALFISMRWSRHRCACILWDLRLSQDSNVASQNLHVSGKGEALSADCWINKHNLELLYSISNQLKCVTNDKSTEQYMNNFNVTVTIRPQSGLITSNRTSNTQVYNVTCYQKSFHNPLAIITPHTYTQLIHYSFQHPQQTWLEHGYLRPPFCALNVCIALSIFLFFWHECPSA